MHKNRRQAFQLPSGQAMLVLVVVVAIVVLYVSEVFISTTSATSQTYESSEEIVLQEMAEGYLENAAIKFLRLPSYNGESLNDGDISCTIVVGDPVGEVYVLSSECSRASRSVLVGMTATNGSGAFTFSKIVKR